MSNEYGAMGQTLETGNGFKTDFMTNPVIKKLGRVTEHAGEGDCASYAGIGFKTIFFLLATAVGIFGFFVIHNMFAVEDANALPIGGINVGLHEIVILLVACVFVIFTPMLAWLIRPTIPVTGTLYVLSQGYLIAFAAYAYGDEYRHLVWLALLITLVLVLAMLILYMSRIIKINHKFNSVLKTLFFTSVLSGIGVFVMNLIPFTRPFAQYITQNFALSIIGSVVFIIIATLFLLSDFDAIEKTVEHQLPKKHEWAAAFGLVFTVIWLYLKVLNLLTRVSSKK